MEITEEACSFVSEQSGVMHDPVIVVFERIYRGWCGETKVINVAPADREQVIQPDNYIEKSIPECKFPIFFEMNLQHLYETARIDVVGWAAFRRLALIQE